MAGLLLASWACRVTERPTIVASSGLATCLLRPRPYPSRHSRVYHSRGPRIPRIMVDRAIHSILHPRRRSKGCYSAEQGRKSVRSVCDVNTLVHRTCSSHRTDLTTPAWPSFQSRSIVQGVVVSENVDLVMRAISPLIKFTYNLARTREKRRTTFRLTRWILRISLSRYRGLKE